MVWICWYTYDGWMVIQLEGYHHLNFCHHYQPECYYGHYCQGLLIFVYNRRYWSSLHRYGCGEIVEKHMFVL